MKFTLSLLLFSLLIASCDNALDIIEARKDIPVVYGFISLSDTAQYIRLEKAFVDETTSALVIAQDPDSLYYDDATVELVRTSNGASFALEMVDGKLEGYSREEGAFAQSPNYLYKIRTADIALEGDEEYTLRIGREGKAESIEASTVLLGQSRIRRPDPVTANILDFDYTDRTRFFWQVSESAATHNLYVDINYRERSPDTNGFFESKSVTWEVVKNLESNSSEPTRVEYEAEGLGFYNFLAGAIPVDEDAERRFEDLTVRVISGGEEINSFVSVGEANLGITSTQDVPSFSNIPGGRGIFSSTNTAFVENVTISNPTRDSLVNGTITRALNFTN